MVQTQQLWVSELSCATGRSSYGCSSPALRVILPEHLAGTCSLGSVVHIIGHASCSLSTASGGGCCMQVMRTTLRVLVLQHVWQIAAAEDPGGSVLEPYMYVLATSCNPLVVVVGGGGGCWWWWWLVVVVFQLHANTAMHLSLCLAADQIHLVAAALAVAPTAASPCTPSMHVCLWLLIISSLMLAEFSQPCIASTACLALHRSRPTMCKQWCHTSHGPLLLQLQHPCSSRCTRCGSF